MDLDLYKCLRIIVCPTTSFFELDHYELYVILG